MTLTSYLDDYYLPFRPSTAPKTIRLYRNSIRKFGQFLGHVPTLLDLDNHVVGKYLAALLVVHKPATVDKERSQLLALWRDARNEGLVDRGPRIASIKVPEPVPRALRVDELRQLWLSFETLQGETGGNPNDLLLRAVATIQLTTGERVGAVSALKWQDINENVVTFRAETRKGGVKHLVKEIPIQAIRYLGALRHDLPVVFPGCLGTTKLFILYKRAYKRAGIKTHGKTSHLLRSSHATYVDLAGGNATGSLGHASPAVTQRHYLDKTLKPDDSYRLLPWAG